MKIILDPGSTHNNDRTNCIDLITNAALVGANAIKFQLFKNIPPNIPLDYEMVPMLKDYCDEAGIEFFASVWDTEGFELLDQLGCKSIKFAHSQRNSPLIQRALDTFENVYVSMDYMDFPIEGCINMFCIPQYPCVNEINFEGIFPRFQGFSDHTLGFTQTTKAVKAGAKHIEKHFKLEDADMRIPDSRFALTPIQTKLMTLSLRDI